MEKVKVEVRLQDRFNKETGEFEPVTGLNGDLDEAMYEADWSKDPGTGRAIIMPDGSEVLNPVPMAPPLGYKKEESIIDMVARQVRAHYEMLKGEDVVDDEKDVNDFGEDEDFMPSSIYEVTMVDEYPDIPRGDVVVPSDPKSEEGKKDDVKKSAKKKEPADVPKADED